MKHLQENRPGLGAVLTHWEADLTTPSQHCPWVPHRTNSNDDLGGKSCQPQTAGHTQGDTLPLLH